MCANGVFYYVKLFGQLRERQRLYFFRQYFSRGVLQTIRVLKIHKPIRCGEGGGAEGQVSSVLSSPNVLQSEQVCFYVLYILKTFSHLNCHCSTKAALV